MRPLDLIRESLRDLGSAKLRSLLTALGIIIGVGSVVLMLSTGEGVKSVVTGAFTDLGSNRIAVVPDAPGRGGGFGGLISTLTVDDAEAVARLEGVAAAAPVALVPARVESDGEALEIAVTGTTPDYASISGQELADGRLFGADVDEAIANEAAAGLLFRSAPLGRTLTVDGRPFTLVGILVNEEQPFGGAGFRALAGDDEPTGPPPLLFIPVGAALELADLTRVAQIALTAEDATEVAAVSERVHAALVERHGVDDVEVVSLQEVLESFNQVTDVLTAFLAAIAAVSLLVGGIGIMNIMLVVVTERTREIGIAKALGARRRTIVAQFLIEAALLALIGGVCGLLLAWLGTRLLEAVLELPALISPGTVALALGVSAAVGLFFGAFPAWRAAGLDPIAALRHE